MLIEPRAIATAGLVASLTLAITLWHLSKGARHARAAREWAIGIATMTSGAMLNAAQGDIHPFFAIVFANSIMLVGVGLAIVGVRRVQALHTAVSAVIVAPALLMLLASMGWDDPVLDFSARVVVYSALMSLQCGYLAWSLAPMRHASLRAAAWFIALPALFLALTMLARSVMAATVGVTPVNVGGGMTTITYLVGSCAFIAMQTGLILLHQLLLLDEVRQASERDTLTGVMNRRGLLHLMPASLRGYALLTMDIDHFKRVNDSFGHASGDAVLAFVGTLLQRALREGDMAARMGGEEFCVLLKESSADIALQVAERLRADIALQSSAVAGGPVTVSVGIALAAPDEVFDTLARRADEALYLAKSRGRNRCEVSL